MTKTADAMYMWCHFDILVFDKTASVYSWVRDYMYYVTHSPNLSVGLLSVSWLKTREGISISMIVLDKITKVENTVMICVQQLYHKLPCGYTDSLCRKFSSLSPCEIYDTLAFWKKIEFHEQVFRTRRRPTTLTKCRL